MNDLPTIIYIAGLGHSGTTLLTLLLSAHSEIGTIGEIKALSPGSRRPLPNRMKMRCTCGVRQKSACPFWQAFDAALHSNYSLSLEALDVRAADPAIFRSHNQAVFATLGRLTSSRFVVDPSKSLDRLQLLTNDGSFHVKPILVERKAHGVVYSEIRKGRPWPERARRCGQQIRGMTQYLAGRDHFHVRYEQLARQPYATLQALMNWIDLPFESRQLAWSEQTTHILAGNRMRFGSDSAIRLDEKWRHHLTWRQKLQISWLASSAFDYTKPLWLLRCRLAGIWQRRIRNGAGA